MPAGRYFVTAMTSDCSAEAQTIVVLPRTETTLVLGSIGLSNASIIDVVNNRPSVRLTIWGSGARDITEMVRAREEIYGAEGGILEITDSSTRQEWFYDLRNAVRDSRKRLVVRIPEAGYGVRPISGSGDARQLLAVEVRGLTGMERAYDTGTHETVVAEDGCIALENVGPYLIRRAGGSKNRSPFVAAWASERGMLHAWM